MNLRETGRHEAGSGKVNWGQTGARWGSKLQRPVSLLGAVEFSSEAGGDRLPLGQCGHKETCEEEDNGTNYAAALGWKEVDGFGRGRSDRTW